MCKEPFNKRKPAPEISRGQPPAVQTPAVQAPAVQAPAREAPAAQAPVQAPVQAPAAGEKPKEPPAKLLEQLEKLAAEEEKVPAVPPWARLAAWCFLGLWIIFGCILLGVYMARYEDAKTRRPVSYEAE